MTEVLEVYPADKDEQWRERIHDELLKKMARYLWSVFLHRSLVGTDEPKSIFAKGQLWKLFSARTPNYSGEATARSKYSELCSFAVHHEF